MTCGVVRRATTGPCDEITVAAAFNAGLADQKEGLRKSVAPLFSF
jgi:hypothetical protein